MHRVHGTAWVLVLAITGCGSTPQVPTKPTVGNRREETSKPIRSAITASVERGADLSIRLIERNTCAIRTFEDVTQLGKPPQTREVGTPRETPCGERVLANRPLFLVAGERQIELPSTNALGVSVTTWDFLSPQLLEGASAPAQAEVRLEVAGPVVTTVDLQGPRVLAADRAWALADQAGTVRAAIAFRKVFPGSHEADVTKRIEERADSEFDVAVGAALSAGNLAAARLLLDEWIALVATASTARAAREQVIVGRERDARIATLVTEIDAAMAATGELLDLGALQRAAAHVDELGKLAPLDPRTTSAKKKVDATRKARQKVLFARARAADKAGQTDEALRTADIAVEALPGDPATKQRAELRKTIARRFVAQARAKAATNDFTAAAEAQSKAEAIVADDREVVAGKKALEAKQAAAEAAIANSADRDRKKAERLAQAEELRKAREAEREKQEADRLVRADEKKRKQEEAKQKLESERTARAEEEKRKQDEAKQKLEAERLARTQTARSKQEAELAAKNEAERKRKDAKAEAERQRLGAKTETERKKLEAQIRDAEQKLAKLEGANKPRTTTTARPTVSAEDMVGDARVTTALVGVWAAVGRAGGDRITLLFNANADGNGSVTMLARTGRVLARQPISWQIMSGRLEITGGERLALRGDVKMKADSLSWAGYQWQRVRGRTTIATTVAPKAGEQVAP